MASQRVSPLFLVGVLSAGVIVFLAFGIGGNMTRHARGFLIRDRLGSLPLRASNAINGSAFIKRMAGLSVSSREDAFVAQIKRGNVPDFLRKFVPIVVRGEDRDGQEHQLVMWVMRDYLSIGSDRDFVRIPLTPIAARRIADENRLMLPTPKLVDDIYKSASVHLDPISMSPGPRMASVDYIVKHNKLIKVELFQRRDELENIENPLIAGHKKDVVDTTRLDSLPGRVAIYGWHRDNDDVIQPLSLVHGIHYLDYSHGIRFVARDALLDGRPVDLSKLKHDPRLAPLVTYEDVQTDGDG